MFQSRAIGLFYRALMIGLVGFACSGNQRASTGSGGAGAAAMSGSGGMTGGASGGASGTASGGASGTASGGASGTASGGASGSGGSAGAAAPACNLAVKPQRSTGALVELAIDTFFADQPFVYGETNTLSDGTTVVPLNVRFYVSAFELVTPNGGAVAVDIVDDAGMPVPYNVHMYNAEDDAARAFRVLAPPGKYTGARFTLGVSGACNVGLPSGRQSPLDDSSQLSWPHGFGYLMLRYEGRVVGPGAAAVPAAIHMGGDIAHLDMPGANVIALDGALTVPETGTLQKTIRMYFDQIFKGATTDVMIDAYFDGAPSEMVNGERLRLNTPGLKLFGFAP